MNLHEFKLHVTRTLLYYEIFDHPLTAQELFALFPKNSFSESSFREKLGELVRDRDLIQTAEFYKLSDNGKPLFSIRVERERLAWRRLRVANFMVQIIKMFPFVRGVFLSGDLSKGVATPGSDIDYVIVTASGRLWVCRTLLILFKKVFLLNRRKYFCLNYFLTEDALEFDGRNYFTATEIAHLKPLLNVPLFIEYMKANGWIKEYFPNYTPDTFISACNTYSASFVQKFFEYFLRGKWVDRLDAWLMKRMQEIWRKRYPDFDDPTREKIFRSSAEESRAYVGNFEERILALYRSKLERHHIEPITYG